ncbi:hypothetical protein B296_00048251 [Ensete ventricosum]|uniref:Uncharacterized protein n=1 Tax=Ensete ventricosum TaxID=4639 RepID=A0A426X9N0_ENSVE|nr:hypothetical protein B296_00048251 [Ensete ventricosum]
MVGRPLARGRGRGRLSLSAGLAVCGRPCMGAGRGWPPLLLAAFIANTQQERVDGSFEARELNTAWYLTEARLIDMIKYFKISQVPHIENSKADALAKSASADIPNRDPPAIASVHRPTVAIIEEVTSTTHSYWRDQILYYKKDTTLLTNKEAAQRVKRVEA